MNTDDNLDNLQVRGFPFRRMVGFRFAATHPTLTFRGVVGFVVALPTLRLLRYWMFWWANKHLPTLHDFL